MGILRDFERRLEGAVEGFFARAFRSGLQPVELAKAIQRYAADYQQVGIDGVYIPNVYRFLLAPDDLERFSGLESDMRRELADVVRRTASERGWRLKGPVRIELREDEGVRVGTYELRGKAEAGKKERSAAAPAAPVERESAKTSVMQAPTSTPATARLKIMSGTDDGQEHTVKDSGVIGRLPECEITLQDPSVSRRHARLARTDDRWEIEDLGSTNGVKLNGASVGRATLTDGDTLELGNVRAAFTLER
jgi:hypothetical protein